MADEELPRSALFVRVRAIVREHRAAYVRVVCDPPDDSVVGFDFVLGRLVGAQCEGLGPVDALEVLARSGFVRFACSASEVSERDPLILDDSLHAWLATQGATVPGVIPEPPEGDWSARGLVIPSVAD